MYTSTSTPFSARMRVTPLQAIIMTIFESNRPLNKKYVWPITAGAVILALYFLHQTAGFFQPTTFMQNFDRPPTMPDRTKILRFEKEMGAGVQYAVSSFEYCLCKTNNPCENSSSPPPPPCAI